MSATLQSDAFKSYFTGIDWPLDPLFVGAKRFEVKVFHLEDIKGELGAGLTARAEGHIKRWISKFNGWKAVKPELILGADEILVDLVKHFASGSRSIIIFLPGVNEINDVYATITT